MQDLINVIWLLIQKARGHNPRQEWLDMQHGEAIEIERGYENARNLALRQAIWEANRPTPEQIRESRQREKHISREQAIVRMRNIRRGIAHSNDYRMMMVAKATEAEITRVRPGGGIPITNYKPVTITLVDDNPMKFDVVDKKQ